MAFNAGAAASWLIANSGPSSKHQCAKYVRMGIEHGGISTAGRPMAAQDYVYFLPKIGFNQISSGSPQVGDLCVINHGKYGHICMWCGSQWISDFKQRNAVPYSSGVNGVWYYRYNGQINNSGISNVGSSVYSSFTTTTYVPMDVDVVSSEPDDLLMKCTFAKRSLLKEILYYTGTDELEKFEEEYESENDSIRYNNQAWLEDFKANSDEDEKNEYEFSTNYGIGDLVKQYYKIGKMGTQLSENFGDLGGAIDMSNIDGGDALKIAQEVLSREERAKSYSTPLTGEELTGKTLSGEKYPTYGFGQVYTSTGKLWCQMNPPFTDEVLRNDFNKQLINELKAVNTIPVPLSNWQKSVLMHRYHFGPAAFKFIKNKIIQLGRTPTAQEYGEMAIAYCRTCSNWNKYGKGWTNGIKREMQDWDRK